MPKSRTGCLTCKKRRLKCDEGKPACRRCLTFGVSCDGYKPLSAAQERNLPKGSKLLLPRQSAPPRPCSTASDSSSSRGDSMSMKIFPQVSPETQLPSPSFEPFIFQGDTESKHIWDFQTKTALKLPSFDVFSSIGFASSSSSTSSAGSTKPCSACQGLLKLGGRNNDLQIASQIQILHQTNHHDRDGPPTTLARQPTNSFFETEDEHRYFRFFSDKTVANIAGCYNPLLWNQSILQACEGESSILAAAIAVGALDLSFKTGRSSIIPHHVTQQEHYQYSLRQYNKAIKQMRETVQKRQDLRTTLLASILIIAFEIYHGNHESALDQIRSSIQLLEDWTAPYDDSLDGTKLSPSPHTVEDDLVHAFYRLEIEGMVYIDKLPIECHLARKDDRTAAVNKLPNRFDTVSEAQIYGKILMRRAIHFILIAWTYDKDIHKPPDKSMYVMDKILCAATPRGLAERDKYSAELSRWYAAFSPLRERILRSPSAHERRDRNSVIILQSHYLCTRLAMDSLFRKSEMWFDTVTPLFVEIISLSKLLLDHPDDSLFVFDSQVILPLDITARKCRDSSIRHEAIRLMNSLHRREGFVDSLNCAKICEWLIGLEEEGMIGDVMPNEKRVMSTWTEPAEEGGMHVWCDIPAEGATGVVRRETIIK